MSFTLLGILNAQAAGAGGAGAYDLLETTVLTSSASSVSFTNIDQSYTHLQLRCTIRDTNDFSAANIRNIKIDLNGDSTFTNYSGHELLGDGSGVFSGGLSAIRPRASIDDTAEAGMYVPSVHDILDYSSTSKNTTVRSLSGTVKSDLSQQIIALSSGAFLNTDAVISISVVAAVSHQIGSRFSLYGIR